MSRWARALGLSLLAVVTGACAVHVAGMPVAGPITAPSTTPFKDPDRISAEDALGELTMWNPCSVVDTDALPESWHAEVTVPVAFEDCEMSVHADGIDAGVQVGYLYDAAEEDLDGGDERDGGITVVPDPVDTGACARDIVFAGDTGMVVRTWTDADDHDGLCDISDTVVDAVLDAVMAHRAAPLDLPEDSIGQIDPCELVGDDLAATVPGLTGVHGDHQVSGHSCWWSTDGAPGMNIEFEIGKQPTGDSGDTVRGRYTTVTRYADSAESSLCGIAGTHVPFEVDGETGLMERIGIYVYQAPGQVEQACTAGQQLADTLWQKLPPL